MSSESAFAFMDRPCAAKGLISYRYVVTRTGSSGKPYVAGNVMIGAKDHEDALREARRSTVPVVRENLEVWNGAKYVPAFSRKRKGKR